MSKNKSVLIELIKGFKIRPLFVSGLFIATIIAFYIVWSINQNVFMFLLVILILKTIIDVGGYYKK